MRKKRIKEIFAKLKEGHVLWKRGNLAYKDRLEKAFEPFFIELEGLGVARHFTEALLFFGKEFVDSLEVSQEELIKNKFSPATIKDAELIFGVKSTKMDDRAIREAKLAEKSGALVYRSLPMKGDKVGIRVLTNEKK
jgi:hypothetical protein